MGASLFLCFGTSKHAESSTIPRTTFAGCSTTFSTPSASRGRFVPEGHRRRARQARGFHLRWGEQRRLQSGLRHQPERLREVGLKLIREAAAAGDYAAQWSLAVFYYHGKGLPKDMTNYLAWT